MHKLVYWKATLIVLAYIKSSIERLFYEKHGHVHISVDSDTGYAENKNDRMSTTGYFIFYGLI